MENRRTNQGQAVKKVVYDAAGPLRPNEILRLASLMVPTLGIATVYRQLRRLQDSGEVRAVDLGINDVRYEPTNRGHHHHFLCSECEEAFDIHGCADGISEMVPPGFTVQGHEITLYGKCNGCRTGK